MQVDQVNADGLGTAEIIVSKGNVWINRMPTNFEILAYEETPLGVLCLRKRLTFSVPQCWVTEVTLNHEFLMSSLHTDSECALAKFAIDRAEGEDLQILVGGLGLGYTAAAALESPRVGKVQAIEVLPQVIGWMRDDLIPLSELLNNDLRFEAIRGDIYRQLQSEDNEQRWDAILIDVDHSPEDQLSENDHGLYSRSGLTSAAKQLNPGGVIALWSYEGNQNLEDAMRNVFCEVEISSVTYHNQHVDESFTDWLFLGKLAS